MRIPETHDSPVERHQKLRNSQTWLMYVTASIHRVIQVPILFTVFICSVVSGPPPHPPHPTIPSPRTRLRRTPHLLEVHALGERLPHRDDLPFT